MNWLLFMTYVLIMTFSPGVNNITSMIYGTKFDRGIVTNYIFGIFVGFFIVMLGTGVFSFLLEGSLPEYRGLITYICAGYLFLLGLHTLFADINTEKKTYKTGTRMFLVGSTLQFVNPKVIMHGAVAMSMYVLPYYTRFYYLAFFSLLLAAVAYVSCTAWSYFGLFFKDYLAKHDIVYKITVSVLFMISAYLMII